MATVIRHFDIVINWNSDANMHVLTTETKGILFNQVPDGTAVGVFFGLSEKTLTDAGIPAQSGSQGCGYPKGKVSGVWTELLGGTNSSVVRGEWGIGQDKYVGLYLYTRNDAPTYKLNVRVFLAVETAF